MRLGWTEVLVVLAVVLVLFGTKRLPALGKSLGKSMRNFKRGVTGLDDEDEVENDPPALEAKPAGKASESHPNDEKSA